MGKRRSLLEELVAENTVDDVWRTIESATEGLTGDEIAMAGKFFSHQSNEYENIPWRVREFIHKAIMLRADVGDTARTAMNPETTKELEEKFPNGIGPGPFRTIKDSFDRARAWKRGESMPGWEEEKASDFLKSLRQLAMLEPDFFTALPTHEELYSDYLRKMGQKISKLQEKDPELRSAETEVAIRRMLTAGWGEEPDFRAALMDMSSILRSAKEIVDIKKDPTWKSQMAELEEILRPLLGWNEMVTKGVLSRIADTTASHMYENMTHAFMHFMKFGSFDSVQAGTKAMFNLLRLRRRFDDNPDLQDIVFGIWKRAVQAKTKEFERIEKEPPEYSQRSTRPYGRFIFAKSRKDNVPEEDDTPQEKDAYYALHRHFNDNEALPQDVALELMGQLEDNSYNSVLKQPTVKYVYRGMRLPPVALSRMLKITVEELGESGEMTLNRLMKTRSGGEGSTAWSIDLEVGKDYGASGPGDYSTLFVAKTADNPESFIQGPDGLYKVTGFDNFTSEKEAVALGPIKIHKVYWEASKGTDHRLGNIVNVKEKNDVSEGVALLRDYIRGII